MTRNMGLDRFGVATALAISLCLPSPASGQCQPIWDTAIGNPGLGDSNGWAHALMAVGSDLYIGGHFTTAGGVPAANVARLNGTSWFALGSGTNGNIWCFAMFDDGSGGGPQLYAGGDFSHAGGNLVNHIAKWTGSQWVALAGGTSNPVQALAVFDDGTGPALYVGGGFTTAGSNPAAYIAKWKDGAWSAVGSGFDDQVWGLTVFDLGGGPALYASGEFTQSGSEPTSGVARWTGSTWTSLGSGVSSMTEVRAFVVKGFNFGGSPKLYVGGEFDAAGGNPANCIATWDGSNWSALGSGSPGRIRDFAAFDTGSGPRLYATGQFPVSGTTPMNGMGVWTGSEWLPIGNGFQGNDDNGVAMAVLGSKLYVGGEFDGAGGSPAAGIVNIIAGPGDPPSIVIPPNAAIVHAGDSAQFTVRADGDNLAYQWRRDGVDLIDGGNISGATTTSVIFSNTQESDEGMIDVVISNPCGPVASVPVSLEVTCDQDITLDGTVNVSDLLLVIGFWGSCAGPPALCHLADIAPPGGDGAVNVTDLLAVISAWGACSSS